MVLAVIKRTGSDAFEKRIDSDEKELVLNLGNLYDIVEINSSFKERNIVVYANPNDYSTGLEPNLFVISDDKDLPCKRIIFGNCLFYKKIGDNFEDLTEDDIKFIKDYCVKANMTENEKSMAGLFEYDPIIVASHINRHN